ncbi:MAG: MATE family efflux transporter, partial [Pseudomonadales bacterium]
MGNTLYRMTVPMVIGIFSMMAFSAVDIFFVSMMGSEELAAISFTLPVTMMLFNLIIGLSVATSVLVGSAIGRGDHSQAARLTTDSLMFTVLLTLIVSTAGFFTIDPLFRLLGASELTLPLIHEYMDIYYVCFGLMVIPMVGNSAIRATGDTKWPSILMIIGGLINVVLDPILIFGYGPIPAMGVRGAALATAGSWLIGFFAGFYLLYVREKLITFISPTA